MAFQCDGCLETFDVPEDSLVDLTSEYEVETPTGSITFDLHCEGQRGWITV